MTTKTKKNAKADDGALRAAMRVLAKKPTLALRANYKSTFGKDPAGLSRDALVKALVSHAEAKQPAPSHPTREEQAEAKRTEKATADGERRRTGARDPRLPAVGEKIVKTYKGKQIEVTVLDDGFQFDGKQWRSLTAIALHETGARAISGPAWFGLYQRKSVQKKPETAPAASAKKPAKTRRARKAKKA